MATIKDIARLAGVSHGTASNVLNGRGNVSSNKILAVQKAAKELGYTINLRAKGLREGRSKTLALMLPNLFDRQYADFYTSFQHYAESQGYRVSLHLANNNRDFELEQLQAIRASIPSGIATFTTYSGHENIYVKSGFSPEEVLYIGHRPNTSCNYIGFNYLECGRALGRKACKYTSVALVTENIRLSSQHDCLSGFMEETSSGGSCQVQHYEKGSSIRAGAIAMDIFSAQPPPQAIFITNYGLAQLIRDVGQNFFSDQKVDIYTISSVFTLPENDFKKYELNYRLLGKEAAHMLLHNISSKSADGRAMILTNYGFRSWDAPKVSDTKYLTIMTLDSPTAHIMENMARLYTKSTGVVVKVSIFSYDGVHEMLTNLNQYNAFDIIRLDATWLTWFAEKIYEPLDKLDPSILNQQKNFLPNIAHYYGQQASGLYALPETPSAQILFYRKDLFESSVLQRLYKETYKAQLRPPQNFDEYNQVAAFFTRSLTPSSPVAYGSTLTLGNTGVAATEFLSRYFSLTRSLFDENDRILLDSPEALHALNLLIKVRDYAPVRHSSWWRDTARFFAEGDVAMTVLFSNYASEMLHKKSRVHTNIGYAMVPGSNPLLGGGAIGVCRYSAHKKEALNFINWFCSEEVSSAMTLLGSVSPCTKTYENYQVIDTYPWLSMSQKCFSTSDVQRWPKHTMQRFDERRFLSILGVNVMQAINGTVDAQTALQNAQDACLQHLVSHA